jgi:signal transduction histidine kinase
LVGYAGGSAMCGCSKMTWWRRIWLSGALLVLTVMGATAAEPRRVLLLHSFGPEFAPFGDFAGRFREELFKQSPEPIDLYEESLQSARFHQPSDERPFAEYLRALFAGHRLDLVVAIGAPAALFFQSYRPQLFPGTPMLITGIDQRIIQQAALAGNDAIVAIALDRTVPLENILRLLPETTTIAVVFGSTPLEKFWLSEMQRDVQRFAERLRFDWYNELSLDAMLKRAAALPPRSAIFYGMLAMDADGVPYQQDRALARLHAVANAPIFSINDSNFGRGIVGGPLISAQELGQRGAEVAVRILGGAAPASIRTPPLGPGAPLYDWRELQRWKISEARLPPGSIVRFREPTVWERYRWELGAIFVAVLIQAAIISWLLIERHRRRRAELESQRRFREVIHLNRTATAGALSASIAHELNQPLGAILSNTEAAEVLLAADPPDLGQLKEILADIRHADQRAADIIQNLRNLLRRKTKAERQDFDLNDAITASLRILAPEAQKRGIALSAKGVERPLVVRADRVHLQQVILNLAMNGMDAMNSSAPDARRITIETALNGGSEVEVSVIDSGTGIPGENFEHVFDTFYTTKQDGTGLGLSIARTIVEIYGGKISGANRPDGGAIFRFTLPLAQAQVA